MERLKRLDRTGWTLRGLPNGTESVAAHSFGVGVTAMLLADLLRAKGVSLNVEKILRISLLHDWAEVRVGDMPRTATEFFGAEVRRRAEAAAFAQMVERVDSSEETYKSLFEDYEYRTSLEAKLVKVADVIDLLVEALALEKAGARGLDEFWDAAKQRDSQLEGVIQETVSDLFQALLTERESVR
ncbi:MAG TPA: HD family hydrolase [Pyrinomonadaceae bacterium]